MIDDHCHPFATSGGPLDLTAINLDTASGPEAAARRAAQAPWRTCQEVMTARLARRLGCEPEELPAARAQASRDWPSYARSLFRDAELSQLVMDVDYPPGSGEQIGEYSRLAGCPVHRVARIEPAIDDVIASGGTARDVLRAVEDVMAAAARAGAVAFKSILSYRTGLAVAVNVTERDADASLLDQHTPVPRRGKACRDWVLRRALGIASELGLPVQIHSGFGDSDTRLIASNPLLLEDLLRTPEAEAATVLVMVGYPWHEELSYLVTTKPHVYADVSMFTLYAPVTLADRLLRMIDLAPANKLLLGTDGYAEPEIYWFGSLMLREAWTTVAAALRDCGCRDGWLAGVRRLLFEDNARELYRLPA